MKGVVREILYRCGAMGLAHRIRNRRALTVLMFHRVLPADATALEHAEREFTFTLDGFCRVLDFVQRHYHVVSVRTLEAASRGEAVMPPRPLLITFDDGWRDTVLHAMPELQRRGLPALLFVASEAVGPDTGDRWWQDALVQAMSTPAGRARLCVAAGWPATQAAQAGIEQKLSAWIGDLPSSRRRPVIEAAVPGAWSSVAGRQMMTPADVQAWLDAGFDLGGHGHAHVPLTLAADLDAELAHSLAHLRRCCASPYRMSFPHGAVSDAAVQAARRAGFDMLFSSAAELVDVTASRHQGSPHRMPAVLGRIHVPENEWTCQAGHISFAKLATFLFARPVASARA